MEDPKYNRHLELEGSSQIIELFLKKGEPRTFTRGEIFLKEGQKSDLVGYVAEGGFRHLIETSDGSHKVAGYSFVGDFVKVFPAFEANVSAVSIQSIRNSSVYILKEDEVFRNQTWEYRCRMAEIARDDIYTRLLVMHVGTPEERYKSLIGHTPNILNEVSLKEIASFLRMTPETLSRVRKKILSSRNS